MKVVYKSLEITAECTCKKFELYGLLCRHIFYVFRLENLQAFPKKYVLFRWSVEAIPDKKEGDVEQPQAPKTTLDGIREMQQIVEETANRLVHNPEKFAKYRDQLLEIFEETRAEFPTATPMDKSQAICSFLGVKKPENHNIKNPDDVSTKGRKSGKSKADVAMDKAKKRKNQCQKCKQYGHNSRGCTSIAEETTPESTTVGDVGNDVTQS